MYGRLAATKDRSIFEDISLSKYYAMRNIKKSQDATNVMPTQIKENQQVIAVAM